MVTVAEHVAGLERRKAPRVKTARTALFSGDSGLLQEGTVVDVSGTGVQIRCVSPEPDGAKLDAEIQPNPNNPDSLPIAARGRVARVRELETGEFAMGVELTLPPVARKDVHKAPFSFRANHATKSKPVRSTSHPDDRRKANRRRWLGLACLMLLFLVTLLLMGRLNLPVSAEDNGVGEQAQQNEEAPSTAQGAVSGIDLAGETDPDTGVDLEVEIHRVRGGSGRSLASLGERTPGDDKISPAPATLTTGKNEMKPTHTSPLLASITVSRELREELPSAWPVRRGQDRMGDGEVLAMGSALHHGGVSGPDSIPVLATILSSEIGPNGSGESTAFEDGPSPNAAQMTRSRKRFLGPVPSSPEAAEHDVFLVVDKGRFLMTVFVRGAPVRQFPVGVGRNDSTPTGRFRVVNKLTDPDWYNQGETVLAGDPRNPLGRRWLGLASGNVSTDYGLHPTKEAGSIGRPASRGCIRLRPEDAETLFRLCPVGTPVEICG